MHNSFKIENNGINVFITLVVKSHSIGKLLTSLAVLAIIGFYIYIASTITKEEISTYIFPLLIGGIVILVLPVRYLLWNLFGQENIIVNTKSISYYRNYGIYSTNLKTKIHDRLTIGFEWTRTFDEIKYGNLIFEKTNEENDLPEHLYTTSVELTFENLTQIQDEIIKLYAVDEEGEFDFFSISLN